MKTRSYFEMVAETHRKFGFPVAGEEGNRPHLLDRNRPEMKLGEFRRQFLLEEFTEFCTAQEEGDLVQIADALVDLVVVALGTAHFYGLPFDELFAEVHRSNLEKVRTANEGESKRGTAWDLRKPEDWTPPDLSRILAKKILRYDVEP